MALRFNPPPNWPTPPEGFVPQPGWQPDPAWGPAPENWQFWLEEEDDATRVLPTDQTEEKPAEEPVDSSEHQEVSSVDEDPTEVFAHAEPTRPLNPYAETQRFQSSTSQPEESQSEEPQLTHSQHPATEPSSNGNYSDSYSQGSYNPQNSYQQNGSASAPAKKSKKVLWIVLSIALVLLLGLFFIIFSLVRVVSDSASSSDTSISQQDYGSDTWSEGASDSGDYSRESTSGETKTYEGKGEKTIDIEKPGGSDSTAWVEYTYKPTDKYDSLDIEAEDSTGGDNSPLVSMYGDTSGEYTGSAFLDGKYSHQKPTTKLKISGEGEWKIVIHPLDDAPVKKAGDSINGTATQAFIVDDSDGATLDVKVENGDDAGMHFGITKFPDDIANDSAINLLETDYPGYEGTVKTPGGKHLYQVESWTGLKWEITLK